MSSRIPSSLPGWLLQNPLLLDCEDSPPWLDTQPLSKKHKNIWNMGMSLGRLAFALMRPNFGCLDIWLLFSFGKGRNKSHSWMWWWCGAQISILLITCMINVQDGNPWNLDELEVEMRTNLVRKYHKFLCHLWIWKVTLTINCRRANHFSILVFFLFQFSPPVKCHHQSQWRIYRRSFGNSLTINTSGLGNFQRKVQGFVWFHKGG